VKSEADPVAVANELRPVLLRLARHVRREFHDLGVTGAQISVLSRISKNPGVGVALLAELEGVSRPRISMMIQELVEAGLVSSERGIDRRRIGLRVTPEAARLLESIRRQRTAWLVGRLGRLSPTELAILEAAVPHLEKLLD
jgi:DNA-binding MarR family transcriptional regulator